MATECQKVVEKLEAKIEEYEQLIEEIMSKPKKLAKVVNGPHKHEGLDYYRIGSDQDAILITYNGNKLFEKCGPKKLEHGTEVVLVGNMIVDVVPEALAPKVEKKSTFKLINWDNIGGLKSQIAEIRRAVELPLENTKLAKEMGVEPIKGILLYGPPGCGKTLVAKAIASTILRDSDGNEDSFVYIKGAELLSWYVGMTEYRIKEMFTNCRKYAEKSGKRAVVFIDEAEAILNKRGTRRSSDVDKTIVPTFLSEMDGFDENSPVVILSTNLPDELDPAILRPGRVDLKIKVDRPTATDVAEIFKIHLRDVKVADKHDEIVKHGVNTIFSCNLENKVSGAMVETIVKTAASKAFARKLENKSSKSGIVLEDLKHSLELLNNEAGF